MPRESSDTPERGPAVALFKELAHVVLHTSLLGPVAIIVNWVVVMSDSFPGSQLLLWLIPLLVAFFWSQDSAKRQVARKAASLDHRLKVNDLLVLSSDRVHECYESKYHQWVDRRYPQLKWQARMTLLSTWAIPATVATTRNCDLTFSSENFMLPMTAGFVFALMAMRVVLEAQGAPKQIQSLCCLMALLVVNVIFVCAPALISFDDTCMQELFPQVTSPLMLAVHVSVTQATHLLIFPCIMEHLEAQCAICAAGTTSVMYTKYLLHNGGLALSSDPSLVGLSTAIVAVMASTLLVSAVRYSAVKSLKIEFLNARNAT